MPSGRARQPPPKRAKKSGSRRMLGAPPTVPSAPSFIPGDGRTTPSFGRKQIRGKRVSRRNPPQIPDAPSYVPGRSLSSKGSMHTMRKAHTHDQHEAHARHLPPAMRLMENQ